MNFLFRPQEALTQAEAKGSNLHGLQIDVSAVGWGGQRVQQCQGGWLKEYHVQAMEKAPQGYLALACGAIEAQVLGLQAAVKTLAV